MLAQAVAAIAVALLGASGITKLLDPAPTTGAMRGANLRSSDRISRALGFLEVVVAAGALAISGIWLIAAFVLYVGFAAFTAVAVGRDLPIQSCGCFGRDDTPPTWLHVSFNLVATTSLALSAWWELSIINWSAPIDELILYIGFTIAGLTAAFLLLARLPQLGALSRS